MTEKDYYRPDEVATLLQISQETVYRWMRGGKLKPVKIEGVTRIPKEELERLGVVESSRK